MKKLDSKTSKKYLIWASVIICLIGIPAILSYFAVSKFYSLKEHDNLSQYKMDHQQIAAVAKTASKQEFYIAQYFHNKMLELSQIDKLNVNILSKWLTDQQKNLNNDFDYAIWDINNKNSEPYKTTLKNNFDKKGWNIIREVLLQFAPYYHEGVNVGRFKPTLDSIILERAKPYLGKQLIERFFDDLTSSYKTWLIRSDSSFKKPPFAAYTLDCAAIILFFKNKSLEGSSALQMVLKDFTKTFKNISTAFIDNSNENLHVWSPDKNKFLEKIDLKLLVNFDNTNIDFVERPNDYISYQYLSSRYRFVSIGKKEYSDRTIKLYSFIGAFFYILCMLPFIFYTHRTIVLELPGKASIRLKLFFLLWFSTGIPLIAMGLISQEHYQNKRTTQLVNIQNIAKETIKNYDRRFKSYCKNISINVNKFFNNWVQEVAKNGFTPTNNEETVRYLTDKYSVDRVFIIGSDTKTIGSSYGFINYTGSMEQPVIDYEHSKVRRKIANGTYNELQIINIVGKKILSDLNHIDLPSLTITKLEIIAESILQLKFAEITNEIMAKAGEIGTWGFTNNLNQTFFNFLQSTNKDVYNYMVVCFWFAATLQREFIEHTIHEANRNPNGMKIVIYNTESNTFNKNYDLLNDKKGVLKDYVRRVGNTETKEFEIATIGDKKYLLMSNNGQYIYFYKIIAMYPIQNVEIEINKEKVDLLMYIVLSIVLAISVAQLLVRSFIVPLNELRKGAIAIEQKNYSYKIENIGKDEFGEVATIFNRIMVGLAEVETAKVVQESLFPKEHFNHNNFIVYGKSVAMSGVGGDYFDYFQVDENSFSALVGDVAGHGIAAALIMAMAKSGMLCNKEHQSSPKEILNILHSLILKSKSKTQRKIMTFQYMYCNSITGEAIYGNAGACSPYIYKKSTGEIEELKLVAPVLGAFKKTIYNDMQIKFENGDAIVFYTDGMVESKNIKGHEIGYFGLQKMIKASYDPDPEKFYKNMYKAYEEHVENVGAQDDITIVIMIYQPPEEQELTESKKELPQNGTSTV